MGLDTRLANNPYSAPDAAPPVPPEASAIRGRLLRKEAILRVLGVLFVVISLAIAAIFGKAVWDGGSLDLPFVLFFGALLLLASSLFFAGYRLVRLAPGRRFALVLTGFFLLSLLSGIWSQVANFATQPIPAIQSCALLLIVASGFWALLSRDGRFILSSEYPPIVAATPGLRVWRTPAMLAGLALVLVAIFTSVQPIEQVEPSALPAPAGSADSPADR